MRCAPPLMKYYKVEAARGHVYRWQSGSVCSVYMSRKSWRSVCTSLFQLCMWEHEQPGNPDGEKKWYRGKKCRKTSFRRSGYRALSSGRS